MNPSLDLTILILAAGRSSRMQPLGDKLTLPMTKCGSYCLLDKSVATALTIGCKVAVAVNQSGHLRRKILTSYPVSELVVEDEGGIGDTIAQSILRLKDDAEAVMIYLADMAKLTTCDLNSVITAHDNRQVTRAVTPDGIAGHPVVFPRYLFNKLIGLRGDRGAASLLKNEKTKHVQLEGDHATFDLDTPEEWHLFCQQHEFSSCL